MEIVWRSIVRWLLTQKDNRRKRAKLQNSVKTAESGQYLLMKRQSKCLNDLSKLHDFPYIRVSL